MEAKLIKENNGYTLYVDGKIIGNTEGHPLKSITNKLSLKNCQAIERGYDLDEFANEYSEGKSSAEVFKRAHESDFKSGFQKALELIGDKKYTEEDVKNAIEYGIQSVLQAIPGVTSTQGILDSYKQSLQKTEWDVTVEMEYVGECNGNNDEGCFQDSPGHNCGCFERRPKLDADGCIILKRI